MNKVLVMCNATGVALDGTGVAPMEFYGLPSYLKLYINGVVQISISHMKTD